MNSLRHHKNYFSAVILFFFLFSADALCYGAHLVEEFGHDCAAKAKHSRMIETSHPKSSDSANCHIDADKETHHEEDETCCDIHNHAVSLSRSTCHNHIQLIVSRPIDGPCNSIPEVYLEKFIPPQNLA